MLELAFFVAEAPDLVANTRWRHVQQDIRTVNPIDMGLDRAKPARGDVFKTQELLGFFMKKFYAPAEPVPQHDLAGGHSDIITGQVAATLRSLSRFGTHQVDEPDVPEIAQGVPDAKLLSLGFDPIRH